MMFVVPSTLQVLLAIVLVLLGVCGNLVMPFVSYRTTLRCPHITVLAALDFTATLLGPGLMLVTIVTGPAWLEHNTSLCHTLNFLNSWLLITCFLVLFFLAVFCQKVQHNVHPGEIRHARRREFGFLAVCFLTGMLLSTVPLLGWSSYNGLPFLESFTSPHHIQTVSNYSIFCLASSLVVLSISIFLAIKALKKHRFYPMQIFWERHLLETKINDPEITTMDLSNEGCDHISSRRNSFVTRRSVLTSVCNSPIETTNAPQKSVLLEETLNVLLEILARENGRTHVQQTGNVRGQSAEPQAPQPMLPGVVSGRPQYGSPGDPFVISSRVPFRYPTRKIFKRPQFLPQFQAPQQQRSLSRLLLLRCCVTLLCWLPVYVTVVLQLFSGHYPQELHVFIQWLIFIKSSISALLPLCDASYRQVWRRIAFSCFKACAQLNGTHADLSKSRDVESRIEGSQQVRLKEVIPLENSRI